jgi:integrase
VADRVEDLLETFIDQRLSKNRSGAEIARLLRREMGKAWAGKSIQEISKRDVVEVVSAIEQRGAPIAANKALKSIKMFLRWCVGRAILDQHPAEGVPAPAKEVARDRVLSDDELAGVIVAARHVDDRYGGIVELLALTGQRREEVAKLAWEELDLIQRVWTIPKSRTKNAKSHTVHLSDQSIAVLQRMNKQSPHVFAGHPLTCLPAMEPNHSSTLRRPNVNSTNSPRSPDGDFTISGALAYLGWPVWGLLLTLPTRFSITNPVQSQGSLRSINATNFFPIARTRSNAGALMSARLLRSY